MDSWDFTIRVFFQFVVIAFAGFTSWFIWKGE